MAGSSPYRVWHGWTSMAILEREGRFQLDIESASGSSLRARDGFRFLDGSAGLWNVSLGHGREDIIRAVADQLARLTYLPNIGMRSSVANELAERLLERAPDGFSRVTFHCTGTAAVEGAVLAVRQLFKMTGRPQRTGVIALEGGYHGCSLLGAALSGEASESMWLEPLPAGFHHVPAPIDDEAAGRSLEALRELIDRDGDRMAAFVYEPVMGVAGIVVPPPSWAREATALCHAAGIKVIVDEVATGMGRTGAWYASADTQPDAIVLGKGISGGFIPLAAVLHRDEVYRAFVDGPSAVDLKYGSTMDGYPAACAAGLAVIRAIERERLVERAAEAGARLIERLRVLERLEIVGPVRGRGMMIGVPLREPGSSRPMRQLWVEKVITRLMAAGVLLHAAQSTLAIMPPLTITDDEMEELVVALDQVLERFNQRHARKEILNGKGSSL